jgi:hypothetical protein
LDSGARTRKLLGSAMFRALINSKPAVCLLLAPSSFRRKPESIVVGAEIFSNSTIWQVRKMD